MILFSAEAILASSTSKSCIRIPLVDDEDFKSSTESTISTSLIHNIASDGKWEQVATWFLNRTFQNQKYDCGFGNLSNCSSEICCLCCPAIEFCGNFTGIIELIVDGLPANVGTGFVPLFLFVISCEKSPRPCSLWNWSLFSLRCARVNSLRMILE